MITAPYRDRLTRMRGVHAVSGWQLKVYTISGEGGNVVEDSTLDAAIEYATQHVPWPDHQPCYGFLTVNAGEEAVWLLVDLWVEDILRHFLFCAPVNAPQQFGPGPDDGSLACVWELAVCVHERSSWIEHALMNLSQPNYVAYLSDSLEIIPP